MTEAEQLFEQVYRTYGPSLYRFCLIQMKNPADAGGYLAGGVLQAAVPGAGLCLAGPRAAMAVPGAPETSVGTPGSDPTGPSCRWRPPPPPSRRRSWACWTTWPPCRSPSGQSFTSTTTRATPSGEIARLLGVTVPTVKMRLKRGRDALRNTWEEISYVHC